MMNLIKDLESRVSKNENSRNNEILEIINNMKGKIDKLANIKKQIG